MPGWGGRPGEKRFVGSQAKALPCHVADVPAGELDVLGLLPLSLSIPYPGGNRPEG